MTEEGIKSARVALTIVELLAQHDELGVSEIARTTGTTKARAFRHLRTLVALGYAVQKSGSDRYARGPRMIALARAIGLSAEDGLIELARPVMQRLHEQFPHSFNLSLVHGEQVSIVESLPGKALIGISVRLNQPIPLHATAAGKLFLADRLARGVPVPRNLAQFTDATIAAVADLQAELERIAGRGWADAPEQSMLGINAISVPIRDHRGDLAAMISAMDSIQFIPAKPPERLVDALRKAASEIEQRIDL